MIRCFIVGCPRSGTTLLQALLASHSKVFSVPESHFFLKSFRGKRAFLFRGFHSSAVLRSWLQRIGMQEYISRVPRLSFSHSLIVKAFVNIMDEAALKKGAFCWAEKTPGHIFVIEEIEKRIPDARFIHVIRDGRAVVASLWDVHKRYPQVWGKRSLAECVRMWNKAIAKSASFVGKPNHFFVSYETLTADPERELNLICRFLGLEFEESMLGNYRKTAKQITLPEWHWVKGAGGPIKSVKLEKFNSIFSESEREYVEKHLIKLPEILRKAIQHA